MSEPIFHHLADAAQKLGVPLAWLKREAEEGRVPAVKTGRSIRVDVAGARVAMLRRGMSEGATR